ALPASIGADAARAYTLSRRTDDPSEAVASVTIDRLAGILSLALLAGGGTLLWGATDNTLSDGWVWLIATGTLTLALAVLFADRLGAPLIPASWRSSGPARTVMSLAHAVARYRDRRLTLALVLALSVVVQLLRVWQAYLLGLGLGITVPFAYYLVFMPFGLLMLLLPVSVAGFGLPQGAIVWLLRPQGVPDSLSFALSTLILLTGLAGNLPGAWLYARSKTY
ncbi:MAG: lysylphosphatidylglycerol synthase transmembrane domain-containing protein, partial [Acidobacteriota bacterium]|nr:lysylphosphatidylglycerol synthase transmembrane domain-containing protein [Acidobacteriota bacterium]